MPSLTQHAVKVLAALSAVATSLVMAAGAATAAPARTPAPPRPAAPGLRYQVIRILSGMKLSHTYTPAGTSGPRSEPLTGPDDITRLGRHLYVGFQNGVGSQGQASSNGNLDSTVVELSLSGRPLRQWDITGKCDGLVADPFGDRLIATVNEDGGSSLYVIRPDAPGAFGVRHFSYNVPLPHNGGTDAISVYRGMILISASAPGTTGSPAPQPTYPAVYRVTLDPASLVATVHPLFYDEDTATVANAGGPVRQVKLALTDPDSNAVVPFSARRFGGDFELTSQGDKEQIYIQRPAGHRQRLFVLTLSNAVDDTAWATTTFGRLYVTDATADTIDVVLGWFPRGAAFAAVTPCDANGAPPTCPAPPKFPPNYLGELNPWTGQLTRVPLRGPDLQPKGMTFVADR
ncbi:MAG TPA: hypothetical protein VN840_05415 [Streptosporangiaceae bacterium]|nr:hypothetical protein [Streptosporangiaceae bacterium]